MTGPSGADLWADAIARLSDAGVEDPQGDATRLMMAALTRVLGKQVKRHHMRDHLNAEVPPGLIPAYRDMIEARAARQPVSQIIGYRSFWKHDFSVSRDTLDPRPETELLVETALELPWDSVLDLGTGTGAILISLLAERRGSRGLGTDISQGALSVARDNAQRIGVTAEFAVADWFDGVDGRFDLIVSNPPYIAADEMAALSPEVREWEPRGALTDEADGLSAYRVIAAGAKAHLNPGGHVLVEIGWRQGDAVCALFEAVGAKPRILSDLDGRDRMVHAAF